LPPVLAALGVSMGIHSSYGKQELDDKCCFLCGKDLIKECSVEHVFPKWLLKKYNLWNQKKIVLLNASTLPYRQLTIPCCVECNTQHLSRVDGEVSKSVKEGFESARKVPEKSWYLWVAKIFYGILRKEVSLAIDRANLSKGNILTEDVLDSFKSLHLFLQAFRGMHRFNGDVPYTILLCNLHDIGEKFDFRDNLFQSTVAVRMGEIGIIVSFEDGGLVKDTYGKYVNEVDGRKLHPVQFIELYAKVTYQVKLLQTPLTYETAFHVEGQRIATTQIVNYSTYVEEWDQEEFSHLLNFHVSQWVDDGVEYPFPEKVSTWMVDGAGDILLLSLEEWKAPNKHFKSEQK
jgi:hypothetical protein